MAAAQVVQFRSGSTSPIAPISSTKGPRQLHKLNNNMASAEPSSTSPTTGGINGSKSNYEGITALMLACQRGRAEDVQNIIRKKNVTVKERTKSGKVALHFCAEAGSTSCFDHVLAAEPFLINAQDVEGYTPLHLAVINGSKDIVRKLITAGADINCLDNERHSLVHWATVCGELEILDILLTSGAPVSTPDIHLAHPIHYAAQMCGTVNGVGSVSRARVQSSTVYGVSPKQGLKILKRLIQFGCPIDVRDQDGRQPLLWAASAGSGDAILLLVNAGGKVDAEDKDGLTALHCAASRGHNDCLETLIALCGAEVDVIDNNGCTALFYAVTLGHADCTELLLNYGAEPNRQDRKGRTPGHCGAAKGQLETLKLLARHGGNLWLKNVRGDLALHEAVLSRRKDLVIWLLSQRHDAINSPNNDGRCPIHLAALNNNVEMVKILIDYRADVNLLMRSGKGTAMTPLDAAIHKGNSPVAKFLQLHGGLPSNSLNDASLQRRINRSIEGQISPAGSLQDSQIGSHHHHPSPEDQQRTFTSPDVFDSSLVNFSRNTYINDKREVHNTGPFLATSTPIMDDGVQTDVQYVRDMEVQVSSDGLEKPNESNKSSKIEINNHSHRKSERRRRRRSQERQERSSSNSSSISDRSSNRLTSRASRKSSRRSRKESEASRSVSKSHSSAHNSEEKAIKEKVEEKLTSTSKNTSFETDEKSHKEKRKMVTPQGSNDNLLDNTMMSEKFSELENVAVQSSETDAREEELVPKIETEIKAISELQSENKTENSTEGDRRSEKERSKSKSKSRELSPGGKSKDRSHSKSKSKERSLSAGSNKEQSTSESREVSGRSRSVSATGRNHSKEKKRKSKSRSDSGKKSRSKSKSSSRDDRPSSLKDGIKASRPSTGKRSSVSWHDEAELKSEDESSKVRRSKSKSQEPIIKQKSESRESSQSPDKKESKSKSKSKEPNSKSESRNGSQSPTKDKSHEVSETFDKNRRSKSKSKEPNSKSESRNGSQSPTKDKSHEVLETFDKNRRSKSKSNEPNSKSESRNESQSPKKDKSHEVSETFDKNRRSKSKSNEPNSKSESRNGSQSPTKDKSHEVSETFDKNRRSKSKSNEPNSKSESRNGSQSPTKDKSHEVSETFDKNRRSKSKSKEPSLEDSPKPDNVDRISKSKSKEPSTKEKSKLNEPTMKEKSKSKESTSKSHKKSKSPDKDERRSKSKSKEPKIKKETREGSNSQKEKKYHRSKDQSNNNESREGSQSPDKHKGRSKSKSKEPSVKHEDSVYKEHKNDSQSRNKSIEKSHSQSRTPQTSTESSSRKQSADESNNTNDSHSAGRQSRLTQRINKSKDKKESDEEEIFDEIEAGKSINLQIAARRRSESIASRSGSVSQSVDDSSLKGSPSVITRRKHNRPKSRIGKRASNKKFTATSEEREIQLQEALLASSTKLRPVGSTIKNSRLRKSNIESKYAAYNVRKSSDLASQSTAIDSGFSDPRGLNTSASEDLFKGNSHVSMLKRRVVISRRPSSGSAKRKSIFSSNPKYYRAPRVKERFDVDALIVRQLSLEQGLLDRDETNSTSTRGGSITSEEIRESLRSPRRRRIGNLSRPRSKLTFSRGEDNSRLSPRPKKSTDVDTPISVTQAMQASMRKYNLERTIFQELLELKRIQIRAGKANEQLLVKRMAENYRKAGYRVNFRDYDGPYTFRNFEKYLYDQLRLLQTNKRLLPRFAPSDDLEKLSTALRKMNSTKLPFLEEAERNESSCDNIQCTHSTHRCHHAAHAYTGVPCAAYIGSRKNGFLPKVNAVRAPGPTQKDSFNGTQLINGGSRNGGPMDTMNLSSPMQISISPRTDTQSPITLEVQQGSNTQVFTLPTKALDPNKDYYVSLSIKPNPLNGDGAHYSNPQDESMTRRPSPGDIIDDGSISAPPPPADNDNDVQISVDRDKHNRSM